MSKRYADLNVVISAILARDAEQAGIHVLESRLRPGTSSDRQDTLITDVMPPRDVSRGCKAAAGETIVVR